MTAPKPGIGARFGALALALALAVVLLLPPAHAQPSELEITLEDIAPSYIGVGDEIRFRGELTNHTDSDLHSLTVWWRMRTPVLTPLSIELWLAGEDDITPLTLARHDLDGDLGAGQTLPYEMVIGTDNSPFDYGSPNGPRGVELVVTATTAEGEGVRGRVRSTIIWYQDAPPTPLAVAVPLAPTAAEWREAVDEGTAVAEPAADRLVGVIEALAGADVTWGVDAAALDSLPPSQARALLPPSGDPPPGPGAPLIEALAWPDSAAAERVAAEIAAHSGERPALSLGWAAPDHQLLYRSGEAGEDLRGRNRSYAGEVFAAAGLKMAPHTAWSLAPLTLAAAGQFGGEVTTILAPPTPRGAATVPPTAQNVLVWSPAEDVVSLLTSDLGEDELRARSLLAATASPHLLATLPPDLEVSDAEQAARNLAVLAEVPWLDLGPVQRPPAPTAPAPGPAPSGSALNPGEVTALVDALHVADSLASISPDPEAFAAAAGVSGFLAVSQAWGEGEDAREPVETLETLAEAEYLRIEEPSTVNLISQGGDLPVGIESSAPVTLAPTVVVETDDARLRVEEPVPAEVAPASSAGVFVPITAVANGDIDATIRLVDARGVDVADPRTFTVRVRADWETTGTAVAAALVAAGFLFGLYRNISSARRRRGA